MSHKPLKTVNPAPPRRPPAEPRPLPSGPLPPPDENQGSKLRRLCCRFPADEQLGALSRPGDASTANITTAAEKPEIIESDTTFGVSAAAVAKVFFGGSVRALARFEGLDLNVRIGLRANIKDALAVRKTRDDELWRGGGCREQVAFLNACRAATYPR